MVWFFPRAKLFQGGYTFQTDRYAQYAPDMIFEHTNMPPGNLKEKTAYYSGRHMMYGYKVEVSVLHN